MIAFFCFEFNAMVNSCPCTYLYQSSECYRFVIQHWMIKCNWTINVTNSSLYSHLAVRYTSTAQSMLGIYNDCSYIVSCLEPSKLLVGGLKLVVVIYFFTSNTGNHVLLGKPVWKELSNTLCSSALCAVYFFKDALVSM